MLLYTRYYSNPTAVLCTGKSTLLANKEHNHGFQDFRVQQYSYFLFSTKGIFIFSWLSSIPHYIYQIYYTLRIGLMQKMIHNWYIYTVQQYTWYPGITRRMILYLNFITTYYEYLFSMCAADVYQVAGSWYDKPCLQELSIQLISGTLFLHVHFQRQTVHKPS